MNHLIAPSILAADFANLQRDVEMVNNSDADWIHIDIMDGVFVPNISFGFPVLEVIKKHALKPLDVHLMIVDPDRYVKQFAEAGAEIITVHYEACHHLNRTINLIKELGCKAGVAINPHTSVNLLADSISDIDLVCIMSVNPGFGAQKFIAHTYEKLRQLKSLAASRNNSLLVEVDGGVNSANIQQLITAGANVLVAGNSVFADQNPIEAISKLKNVQATHSQA